MYSDCARGPENVRQHRAVERLAEAGVDHLDVDALGRQLFGDDHGVRREAP